jgi:hypothetical protein
MLRVAITHKWQRSLLSESAKGNMDRTGTRAPAKRDVVGQLIDTLQVVGGVYYTE